MSNNGNKQLVFKAEIVEGKLDIECPTTHIQTLSYLEKIINHKIMMLLTEQDIKKEMKTPIIVKPSSIMDKFRKR